MNAVERVHGDLLGKGWAVAEAKSLGFPAEAGVIGALAPALVPDPRAPGKLHARDVIGWSGGGVFECASVAHGDVDDFSRAELLSDPRTVRIPEAVLAAIPPGLARQQGRMSADYFRYFPGTESPPHQDEFGDLVAIWVLGRAGKGAESFLLTPDREPVMRGVLAAGQVLVFRDEMFLHGVTELVSGHRDALIFITLKDGGP